MVTYRKKLILILCLTSASQQALGMSAYAQHAWREATATRKRTVASIIAASYLGYEIYRFMSLSIKKRLLANAQKSLAPSSQEHKQDQEDPKPLATLFAHGLGGSHACGNSYDRYLKMNHEFHTFNFVDAGYQIANTRKCGLAQEHDMKQLKAHIDSHSDKNLILLGLSRGASTVISAVGAYKPKNVKAIIVESPFDNVRSIVSHKASYASWIPCVTSLGNIGASFAFPNYSTCALSPIDYVTYIPDEIPVLFICSKQDSLIPTWSTKRLYNKLKSSRTPRGIDNVYLTETEYGHHANILGSNEHQYRRAVHAFYKKAGLPESTYNAASATQGEQFLT